MPGKLTKNQYGKAMVRLTKVTRLPDRHELKEMWVSVMLRGDFAETYLSGDNSSVIATDSMKNTVYVLAKKHPIASFEDFAAVLGRHFVQTYPQVEGASVSIRESRWTRLTCRGGPHPHAFILAGSGERTCYVITIGDQVSFSAGLRDLAVLKTTDSAFTGYVRDEYTTLPETSDRIFATRIEAAWDYDAAERSDWNARYEAVRQTLLDVFAKHKSLSVQQTLHAMGQAVITRCPGVRSIEIKMPNEHRVPFDFGPFGLSNENDIFVPVSEPFGYIQGTITRE